MYAAQKGYSITAQALLDNNAEVNLKNKRGKTALMFAAAEGDIDTTQSLLRKGADTTLKDNNGKTALRIAAENKHFKIVKLLKAAGAKD
jgi:ankyrin repeat protein